MMANPHKGEICFEKNNQKLIFAMTLHSLAQIENHLEGNSFLNILKRFAEGNYTACDILAILQATLKNKDISEETLADISFEESIEIITLLIHQAFPKQSAQQQEEVFTIKKK